jgi:hypothetical protein
MELVVRRKGTVGNAEAAEAGAARPMVPIWSPVVGRTG